MNYLLHTTCGAGIAYISGMASPLQGATMCLFSEALSKNVFNQPGELIDNFLKKTVATCGISYIVFSNFPEFFGPPLALSSVILFNLFGGFVALGIIVLWAIVAAATAYTVARMFGR